MAIFSSSSFITDAEAKKLLNRNYLCSEVPSVFKCVHEICLGIRGQKTYPYIPNVNRLSRCVVQIAHLISTGSGNLDDVVRTVVPLGGRSDGDDKVSFPQADNIPVNTRVVYAMLDMHLTRNEVERLPAALHYLFAESLEYSRLSPPIERGIKAYELLMRPELLAHAAFDSEKDNYGE